MESFEGSRQRRKESKKRHRRFDEDDYQDVHNVHEARYQRVRTEAVTPSEPEDEKSDALAAEDVESDMKDGAHTEVSTDESVKEERERYDIESFDFKMTPLGEDDIRFIESLPAEIVPGMFVPVAVVDVLSRAGFTFNIAEGGKDGDFYTISGTGTDGVVHETDPLSHADLVNFLREVASMSREMRAEYQSTSFKELKDDETHLQKDESIVESAADLAPDHRRVNETIGEEGSVENDISSVHDARLATLKQEIHKKRKAFINESKGEREATKKSTETETTSSKKDVKPKKSNRKRRQTAKSAESQVEAVQKEVDVEPSYFDERFKEFGIREEDMKSIEGFERLTRAQQRLLFENFTQLTLGNVKEEAERLVSDKIRTRREEAIGSTSAFFGKIFEAFGASGEKDGKNNGRKLGEVLGGVYAGVRNSYDSLGAVKNLKERAVIEDLKKGGFKSHEALLKDLTQGLAHYGPRVHEYTGEIDLVNIRDRAKNKEVRDEEWFATKAMNEVANELASTPLSWRATVGTGSEHDSRIRSYIKKLFGSEEMKHEEEYRKIETEYKKAQQALKEVLRKKGESDSQIAFTLIGIDSRVGQLQMLRTDPDAVGALAEIENRTLLGEAWKSVRSEKGFYFALGYGARSVGGIFAGMLGAPIASAGIRYLRAWDDSAVKLTERDKQARAGMRDTESGALNIVDAHAESAKIRHLIDRLRRAEGTSQHAQLLGSLETRLSYVRDKQMLGRMNFGSRTDMLMNQKEFALSMGEAISYVSALDENVQKEVEKVAGNRRKKLSSRLTRTLSATEERIEGVRLEYRNEHQFKAAAIAGGFSLAGAILASLVHGSEVEDAVKPAPKPQSATAPSTEQGAHIAAASPQIEASGESDDIDIVIPKYDDTPWENDFPGQNDTGKVTTQIKGPDSRPPLETPHTSPDLKQVEFPSHRVVKGDTLTGILMREVPKITNIEESVTRDRNIARFIQTLSPEDLKKIGVLSGNPDLIRAGRDTINITELNRLVEERMEQGTIPRNLVHGATSHGTPSDEGQESDASTSKKSIGKSERQNTHQYSSTRITESAEAKPESEAHVTLDPIVLKRSENIRENMFEMYGIDNNSWKTLRSRRLTEVLREAHEKKGLIDQVRGRERDRLLMLQNFESIARLASQKGIDMKPLPKETVEDFVRRFSEKLAFVKDPNVLHPALKRAFPYFTDRV